MKNKSKEAHTFTCSIGIMVYNEAENIGSLLDALLAQEMKSGIIEEIVVVASGCTDRTVEIIKEYTSEYRIIKLLTETERNGKASAINYYLSRTKSQIIILESGDTIPLKSTIENLICHFNDPSVGMVGGHPIPVNDKNSFIGYTVHLLWHLHHEIALKHPKCGELVAFRNEIAEIPGSSAVDEANIEALISDIGYKIIYAPDAIVWNKGPEKISEFLAQRRRIAAGHKKLKHSDGYSVSTNNSLRIVMTLIKNQCKQILWIGGAIMLEIIGRLLGNKDYYLRNKNHYVWDIAKTTKNNIKHDYDKITFENTSISSF